MILEIGKKKKCPFCGAYGHELIGNYEQWYNLTHTRYIDYVKENGIIDDQYGCGTCMEKKLKDF